MAFTEYPIYYLTACSYSRRPILARPDVHDSVIRFGLRAAEYGVTVGRYVIMRDHIHQSAEDWPYAGELSTLHG
jgi:hypothetical protein